MRIGIIGTRGIPNYYGGFEECAQHLGVHLTARGHEVYVYNSHKHPYQEPMYEGVHIIHKYDPEHRVGTFGQFIYDLNCIIDSRQREFDVLLMMGYTSSSIWQRFLPTKPVIITNMDGMEWKRSKYSYRVQQFLKRAERWAALGSNVLIADSQEIRKYLLSHYKSQVVHVAYGARPIRKPDPSILDIYGLQPGRYNLIIARLEPENNIETILNGVVRSKSNRVTLVMGNHHTPYGEKLKAQYRDNRIRFVKGSYKKVKVQNLRYFSHIYFHGHTVGGTNPSLLEAMACSCMICAHDNPFNREILGEDGNYFLDSQDIANALDLLERNERQQQMIKNNLEKIRNAYSWKLIAEQYEVVFEQALI